jgi:hypothetical protein
MYKNDENEKLTNPKIMNLYISSLKSLHKQQENKKKNYKKLMNLFSVRVQRYDDSSSHKTDDKLKNRKCDFANRIKSKRKNRYGVKDTTTPIKKILIEEYESSAFSKEYEYNSDSSIYKKDNIEEEDQSDKSSKLIETRKTMSLSKTHFAKSERAKLLKHKFNKQIDLARSKKFPKEKTIDTSVYNSYKSINSSEKKNATKNSERIFNYYLIKSIENEDIIFNKEDIDVQYDENYKCYYSLDHKSRIIYIKTSPKLLSSLSSIFNSRIVSRKTTKNISASQSQSTHTPKKDEENISAFDHETIIEKLKNIESLRNDVGEYVCLSQDENEYSDNNNNS